MKIMKNLTYNYLFGKQMNDVCESTHGILDDVM